jgi:hypothetical protein
MEPSESIGNGGSDFCSLPPFDRPHLFGRVIQFDKNLIDIAPAPAFRRIVAFDDRMFCLMEVRGCVAVR